MARILVIEDNAAGLELMTYLLQAFGHTPLVARDGEEGLAAARQEAPDLIVCDLQLPGLDGYAVAQQLKADIDLRAIPLVAVTAYAMVGDREKTLASGFDGYMTKPIVPETFVAQLEVFLPQEQRPSLQLPPVIPAEPAATIPKQPVDKRATILVVDDSRVNMELLRSILEPFGYRVQEAYHVDEALKLARQAPPDLILSDLHMPGADGFDLLHRMKSDPELQHIVILIHSATIGSAEDRRRALRLGAAGFISRPLEPQTLLAEIQDCLDGKGGRFRIDSN